MGIKVGVTGTGSFAQGFIPCFKVHPLVDEVILCDLDNEKLEMNSKKFGITRTCTSHDQLCDSDVDVIAIFTQNWLHGPQAVQALNAGKHTYSAVPMGMSVEEIKNIIEAVNLSGKIYMLGETSYYYPAVMYCREEFKKGTFGHIVYAEAEYYHDFDHGLYKVFQNRAGDNWREYGGGAPMHYPTHSVSEVVSVTGAHATHVSCQGFVDRANDGVYNKNINHWKNEFSDETALMKMSDGSCARINEFRRIGHPGGVLVRIFGTEKCYDSGKMLSKNREESSVDVSKYIKANTQENIENLNDIRSGFAPIQFERAKLLPKSYENLPNGHQGSHQFLVDDFIKSIHEGKLPHTNAWEAARYNLPGIIAHESAKLGGVLLEIPDFGDAPY